MQIEGKWWLVDNVIEFVEPDYMQLDLIGGRATLHNGKLRTGRYEVVGGWLSIEFPPALAQVDDQDGRSWERLRIHVEGDAPFPGYRDTVLTGINDETPWKQLAPDEAMSEIVTLYSDPPEEPELKVDDPDAMPF